MSHKAIAHGLRHATLFFAALLIAGCGAPAVENVSPKAPAPERPNIVFILADDLSSQLLRSHLDDYPNIKALGDNGVTFTRSFVSESVCCPSRVTSLTGLYRHNHGVEQAPTEEETAFRKIEDETLPVWLKRSGYETGYFGKYLNGWDGEHRPPGWDEFEGAQVRVYARGNADTPGDHFGYLAGYGPAGFNAEGQTHTQVFAEKTAAFVRESAAADDPFFAYVAPYAPHTPAAHPREYERLFTKTRVPRTTSFNEADVSDKPEWVQARAPLSNSVEATVDETYRDMLRSMKDVDDMVDTITSALRESGELSNTYVVFASDNGYHAGQHRLAGGKWTPYEEDIRVPLIVSGPGVPAGATRRQFVLNTDWAPTLAQWAGVETPEVDGRSFAPLLSENPQKVWRTGFLVEATRDAHGRPAYSALRSPGSMYVEYTTGERELYDLKEDRQQTNNLVGSTDPAVLDRLSARLEALKNCSGVSCRKAEQSASTQE